MIDLLERLRAAVADRYDIERPVGTGGMATVYLAVDTKHERRVALKVMHPEFAASLGAERFHREIKIAAQLNHPNIVPLYDSGDADDLLYYTMPLVEGETLRARMNREKQLPLEDALEIIRGIGDALGYAHSLGVIHRDIKPENILLSGGRAMLADFGMARALNAASGARLTQTGLAVGTPWYMSPEQAMGSSDLDGRSDLYSLALVLFEMLTGAPPHSGPTPQAVIARRLSGEAVPPISTVREGVPQHVERSVEQALARAPADRFTTAEQFIQALTSPAVDASKAPGRPAIEGLRRLWQRLKPWGTRRQT